MPHHNAEKKHLRQTDKRTASNRILKGRLKKAKKRAQELIVAKEPTVNFDKEVKQITSTFDRLSQKGIIHRNAAARYKSGFLNALKKKSTAK